MAFAENCGDDGGDFGGKSLNGDVGEVDGGVDDDSFWDEWRIPFWVD